MPGDATRICKWSAGIRKPVCLHVSTISSGSTKFLCPQANSYVSAQTPSPLTANTALRTIFNGQSNTNSGDLHLAYRQDHNDESSFSKFSKQRHAHYRSCMSQAFTSSALKDFLDRILTYVTKFVNLVGNDGVPREHSTTAAGRSCVRTWLFTSLGDLCLDKSFNMLEKEGNRFIIPLVVNTLHRDFLVHQSPRKKNQP